MHRRAVGRGRDLGLESVGRKIELGIRRSSHLPDPTLSSLGKRGRFAVENQPTSGQDQLFAMVFLVVVYGIVLTGTILSQQYTGRSVATLMFGHCAGCSRGS